MVPDADKPPEAREGKDYSRQLGVVESLVAITHQCPSVSVRRVAERALDAIKRGGPDELRKQVYFVLTAMKGWRGERARQVHESLQAFLDGRAGEDGAGAAARDGE